MPSTMSQTVRRSSPVLEPAADIRRGDWLMTAAGGVHRVLGALGCIETFPDGTTVRPIVILRNGTPAIVRLDEQQTHTVMYDQTPGGFQDPRGRNLLV